MPSSELRWCLAGCPSLGFLGAVGVAFRQLKPLTPTPVVLSHQRCLSLCSLRLPAKGALMPHILLVSFSSLG